jgi:DNA repair exonuclease SbcCD ATPase subunit
MRFKGEFELEPAAGVHAIVAEHEEDAERSNWCGKSSYLAALRFGLYGTVPTATLDGAITYGEGALGVDLEFDDSTFVSRTKDRGKSVQLRAIFPDGDDEVELTQDAAQKRLVEHLRLSEDDFLATSFFEQKEISRFIIARPADRTEIVNGWLGLEPLERAAKIANEKLTELTRKEERLASEEASLASELQATGCDSFECAIGESEAELERLRAEVESVRAEREAWLQRANERAEEIARRQVDERTNVKREQLLRKRNDLVETRDEAVGEVSKRKVCDLEPLNQKVASAREVYGQARADCDAKEKLVRGEFDGKCPVNGGQCPIVDEMNDDADQARQVFDEAVTKQRSLCKVLDDATHALRDAGDNNRERERSHERMERINEQIVDLNMEIVGLKEAAERAEKAKPLPEPEPSPPEPDTLPIARLETRIRRLQEAETRASQVVEERAKLRPLLAAQRAAVAILGRGGAPRRISEGALRLVEQRANDRLAAAGIALVVHARWGRETKQLESACSTCGEPFPPGRKAKKCEKCGALRRHKSDGKLHIELSNTSGAAEDLGGLAFQLAAARWLRERRGSPWSVAVLDEPFGALDGSNKRALAASLASLLDDGFDQAFVVAHDKGILDALPHRIRVIAGGEHSRVELG